MTVQLDNHTPLFIASSAIRQCWQSQEKSDTKFYAELCPGTGEEEVDSWKCADYAITGPNDRELISRIANKFKHASTLEHLSYNFTITGVSRALLQELVRHRMSSFSVKSSRYTLGELKSEKPFYANSNDIEANQLRAAKYLVYTGNARVDESSMQALENLRLALVDGVSNDLAKYCLPESYKTSLAWTINARSLQNFLSLRSNRAALWEIRDLAQAVYDALPTDHQYLFTHCIEQP